jgi:hypothetical protein
MRGCGCGCYSEHGYFWPPRREEKAGVFWGRRFVSKAEQVEQLQEYQEALEKELAGVKEAIEELKR